MNIRLVPINASNWEDAARLQVREDQADFIVPNVWSIAESQFYPALQPTGIYDGFRMVGFLMYGLDPQDHRYWLYRFMIGRDDQGKGYGTAALNALITRLRQVPDCFELNVGYHHDNLAAERLYLRLGFQRMGAAPWGELMARLTWS
jgi:diamine N-acetyltransferase